MGKPLAAFVDHYKWLPATVRQLIRMPLLLARIPRPCLSYDELHQYIHLGICAQLSQRFTRTHALVARSRTLLYCLAILSQEYSDWIRATACILFASNSDPRPGESESLSILLSSAAFEK